MNLVPIKTFLGKYFTELNYSCVQEKYKNTQLDTFFEQRFLIQHNKVQMIIDPALKGLIINICGNELHISQALYDHPSIAITNSLENNSQSANPKSLYNSETFSTIAYLVCQNHTMFQITGQVDEPIYVKYRSDYESFYNSVVIFDVASTVSVDIVEEIESGSALNMVTNYILQPRANIRLTTYYQNHLSGLSFAYRNIIAQDGSQYNHMLLGRGSSNIIDENKILSYPNSKAEFLGIINSVGRKFHSILSIQPMNNDQFSINVDYRDVLYGKDDVTFYPLLHSSQPNKDCVISVTNVSLDEIPRPIIEVELNKYLKDLIDRILLTKTVNIQRFYDNKSKFLRFP
jgi:hypothetical protein